MKSHPDLTKVCFLTALVALGAGLLPPAPRAGTPEIAWQDYQAGLDLARTRDLPVFLYFWAEGCRPCELYEQKAFTDSEIVEYINARLVPIRINLHEAKDLGRLYRVPGTPTLDFLTPAAKPIDSLIGYVPREHLLKVLHYIGDGHYKTISFQEYQKQNEGEK